MSIARTWFGQRCHRNTSGIEYVGIPCLLIDIEDHGAAGIGVVSGKRPAGGQTPDEPAIDGAEEKFPGLSLGTGTWNIVEKPADLACTETGIDLQARTLFNQLLHTRLLAPLATQFSATGILPNQCMIDWLTRQLVPSYDGLSLVGDGEGIVVGIEITAFEQPTDGLDGVGINLLGIMFHPSGLRIILLVSHRGAREQLALLVKEKRLGSRCALVNSNDIFHNLSNLSEPFLTLQNLLCSLIDAFVVESIVVEDL